MLLFRRGGIPGFPKTKFIEAKCNLNDDATLDITLNKHDKALIKGGKGEGTVYLTSSGKLTYEQPFLKSKPVGTMLASGIFTPSASFKGAVDWFGRTLLNCAKDKFGDGLENLPGFDEDVDGKRKRRGRKSVRKSQANHAEVVDQRKAEADPEKATILMMEKRSVVLGENHVVHVNLDQNHVVLDLENPRNHMMAKKETIRQKIT